MNMQVGAHVLLHKAYGIATVTLNRSDYVNAIDEQMRLELRQIFDSVSNDDEIRVVILTGNKGNFCGGSDIASLEDLTKQAARKHMQDIRRTAMAIARCNKPVIAAVEGHIAGAGIGLALLCDRIIASNVARFTFSNNRIGLGPDWGLSITLSERVGRAEARDLLWDATKLNAQVAKEIGLADETCLPGSAMDTAWADARAMATRAPLATQGIKCHYRLALDDLDAALENEAVTQVACLMSEDFIEGLNAFRDRRRPEFSK